MNKIFPVTHSILSVKALATDLLPNYNIESPMDCRFLKPGLNDTFLVNTQGAKYILRIYRKDWRSLSEILYELDALLYLKREDISVSVPIAKKDGELIGTIMAPEGLRYVVLFTYAPGKELAYETKLENEAYRYGKAVAKIHTATNTFQSAHSRFVLDLDYLLEAPMRSLQPFLSHRPEDWEYLTTLAQKLRRGVQDIPLDSLEMGFCHGDFHSGNAHLDQDETVTFFDFDCCGFGWRAYDIASFRWNARLNEKEKKMWPSFLSGYEKERYLSDLNIQAINYFVLIRQFWFLGIVLDNGHDWGFAQLNDPYFDWCLKFFREWEAEYLEEKLIESDA
jgi:Ser/Thr protein kinase RdoA (MazF antagonist)